MTEDVLTTIKSSLEDMLAELNSLKISICVTLVYVEQKLEEVKKK